MRVIKLKYIVRNNILKPIVRYLFGFVPPLWMAICKQAYYSKHWPNLKNPKMYSEKLLVYMNSDLMESYYVYVDKILVRDYVEKIVGAKYLTKVYAVFDSVDDIVLEELPEEFFLKFNHGCGDHLPCYDKEQFKEELQNKKQFVKQKLGEDYSIVFGERQYHKVKAKLFAEEMLHLNFPTGSLFRLYTFSGMVRCIQIFGVLENGEEVSSFYDAQWNKLDMYFGYKYNSYAFEKPENLKEVIEVAEKLAARFPFVRVDLYNLHERIVFSELTFSPYGACVPVFPNNWEYELGKLFNYPE